MVTFRVPFTTRRRTAGYSGFDPPPDWSCSSPHRLGASSSSLYGMYLTEDFHFLLIRHGLPDPVLLPCRVPLALRGSCAFREPVLYPCRVPLALRGRFRGSCASLRALFVFSQSLLGRAHHRPRYGLSETQCSMQGFQVRFPEIFQASPSLSSKKLFSAMTRLEALKLLMFLETCPTEGRCHSSLAWTLLARTSFQMEEVRCS